MEFYPHDPAKKTQSQIGFNSQRDGILQRKEQLKQEGYLVSIPNGMEFYSSTASKLVAYVGFNSQRDGILLLEFIELKGKYTFQFPTVWNSTFLKNTKEAGQGVVSIPNGMEFY